MESVIAPESKRAEVLADHSNKQCPKIQVPSVQAVPVIEILYPNSKVANFFSIFVVTSYGLVKFRQGFQKYTLSLLLYRHVLLVSIQEKKISLSCRRSPNPEPSDDDKDSSSTSN